MTVDAESKTPEFREPGFNYKKIAFTVIVTAIVIVLCLVALYLFLVYEGPKDDVQQTSDNGLIEIWPVSIDARRSSPDIVASKVLPTVVSTHEKRFGRSATHHLPHELPAGVFLNVSFNFVENGIYHHAAGMMGGGHYHIGKHSVSSAVMDISSSDPSVATVEIIPSAGNRCVYKNVELAIDCQSHSVNLQTLSPGTAVITITVAKVDNDYIEGNIEAVTDSITVRVVQPNP